MKKIIRYTLSCLVIGLACVACEKKTETTTYSEALVTSMRFAANDSFPGLSEANFTIITAGDTGRIFNHDSLRFGTSLDSVVPYITFNHTPFYSIFYSDSDTIVYSGADTVNMNPRPVKLFVMASDQEHGKWYDIFVNVHTVDPDLYIWEQLCPSAFSAEGAESRALWKDGQFYLFVNNGFSCQLYTSVDAAHWSAPAAVTGLPADCAVRQIILADGAFRYAAGAAAYTSLDGATWTNEDYSAEAFTFHTMLYAFNDSVWAVCERKADACLQLAVLGGDGKFVLTGDTLSSLFPVSDFATLTFESAAHRSRAMVMGGRDRLGNVLNTRWNVEFLPNRGYNLANFSIEQPSFASLAGVSLAWYDHAIHLFGGVNADAELDDYQHLVSYDEGLHWQEPDSVKAALPNTYMPRQQASVVVTPDHYIYVIGGRSRTASFADVWRGRLNRTTFADYED